MFCAWEKIEYLRKMLHTKMEGKRPRRRLRTRWKDKIRKDIEMREDNWEENKKWENRDGWRFLFNSRPIYLDDEY